jgi:superfamily II DNA or RNA helicase
MKILNNLDSYISTHKNHSSESSVRLKDRQFTVFEDIRNSLEQGQKEGYVKLPTGVGKTILFLEFIKAINSKTMIVVPTRQLIEQTEQKIKKFTPELKHGKVYSYEKNFGEDTTITTYDSFVSSVKSGKINPEEYKVLILDEVHRSLSMPRREAVSKFENIIKIGFTATPKYSEEKQVSKILENEIHSLDVKEATEEGLLSSFSCIVAHTNIDLSSVDLQPTGEYDKEQLEKVINIEARNKAAADMYEQGFKDKSAIVFCSSINHANDVARKFIEKGITAVVITGETHRDEQKKIIEDYESGKIKVLLTVDLLLEGFDAQNASVCFNLAPTHSHIRAEQRSGRVLRIDDNNPQKHSYVIDFLDHDNRENKSPILFSEIVGSSAVYPTLAFDENIKEENETEREIRDISILPNFNVEGLKIIIDSKEVLRISQKFAEKRAETLGIPDGWITANRLQAEIGTTSATIKTFVEKFRTDHPDWFRDIKTHSHTAEHYHPELVEIIKENLTKTESPNDWQTTLELAKNIKRDYYTIQRVAEEYRDKKPEWFQKFKSGSMFVEHYHPELIKIITRELSVRKERPTGWETPNALAKNFNAAPQTIVKIAEKYKKENPDWFQEFTTNNQLSEHYSPELISLIKNELESGEGWESLADIAKELQVDRSTIQNYVHQYIKDKPEWFKVIRSKQSYHPDLIAKIREDIKTEKIEENWLNASQLISKGMSFNGIKKFVEQYRKDYPNWFRIYQQGTKKIEHYAPELIEKIKDNLMVPPPEEGWFSSNKIGDMYHIAPKTILRFVEKFKSSNPEWFKKLKTGGKITEHYSPELINKIQQEFKK